MQVIAVGDFNPTPSDLKFVCLPLFWLSKLGQKDDVGTKEVADTNSALRKTEKSSNIWVLRRVTESQLEKCSRKERWTGNKWWVVGNRHWMVNVLQNG